MVGWAVNKMKLLPDNADQTISKLLSFVVMLLGILLGITHPPLPVFVTSTLSSLAACFSALAMFLTGYVIGKFEIRKLLKVKPVYILTLLRTILIPIGVYFLFKVSERRKKFFCTYYSLPPCRWE